VIGTTKTLAEILGISERRVNQIANEGIVFKREDDGKYNIPVCVRNYYRDKYMSEGSDEAKKLKWEAELKKLKAEEAEFKNAIIKGEYISKDEITAELQRFFVVLKRSMLGYSRRIAVEVSPYVEPMIARRIEKMVQELTLDALEQISIDGIYEPPKKKKASAAT
jgi:phage terminase Nu1 subunit (DNA packaging protein)